MSGFHTAKVVLSDGLLAFTNRVIANLPSQAARHWFYRDVFHLKLHRASVIFLGATFDSRGGLTLGEGSTVNRNCHFDTRGGIEIGRFVSIGPDVSIYTADHDMIAAGLPGRTRPVKIEDGVFIGARALILPGVVIGEGAAVGAGSVVTRDVPAFHIAVGVPARTLEKRRPANGFGPGPYTRWFH